MKRHARNLGILVSVLVFVAGCTLPEPPDGEQRLPVYDVVRAGPSASQVSALESELNLGAGAITFENAIADFFAPERFAYVPTGASEEGPSFDEEEGAVVTYEPIDFGALDALQAPTTDEAARQFGSALDATGLTELFPQGGSTQVTQKTVFEWQPSGGTTQSPVPLDARVAYDFTLTDDRLPLLGPGATVYATFDDAGATSLRYAFRRVEPGEEVAILSDDEAMSRCSEALGRTVGEVNVSTRMVYYAPPLELGSVATLLPHVECSGTATVGGEEVALLQQLLPAVEDASYVPSAELDVLVEGADVRADVRIDGGRAPYTISWSSTHVDLPEADGATSTSVQYSVTSRAEATQDTLVATVTDANGIEVQARQTFDVDAQVVGPALWPQVGGVRDFGTENAVTNEFGALEKGFRNQMSADGVTRRFSWTGTNAWEQDFKAPGDSSYIDDTDITFYVGHGYGGGFTFEDSSHDDGRLTHTDADGDWGNGDLEWLALYSCQVLRDDWNGLSYFDRWRDEFDGLHLILGFHTNAYVRKNFSRDFARNLVDREMRVRSAWMKASDDTQPTGVAARVVGVYGSGASSINDHFWGHGSVSPDLRGEAIAGRWAIKRVVD